MPDFTMFDGQKLLPVALVPPIDTIGGAYAKGLTSGVIAAGQGAGSPVFAFRYTGSYLCLVKRVIVSAANAGTGFTAGLGHLDLFAARGFTANDTGGNVATLTTNNGKLRTSHQVTAVGDIRIANTAALGAGTRTLDTDPLASLEFACSATASAVMVPTGTPIFEAKPGDHPLLCVNNEGFEIQATVTATGTWGLSVSVQYDEVEKY